jgi:gas vesicle protein GvpL/GvpF
MSETPQISATDPRGASRGPRRRKAPTGDERAQRGWYLYGIVPRTAAAEALGVQHTHGDWALETLAQGEIAAVVGQVPLAEFLPEALEVRLRDTAWLEGRVRHHNRVISAIHARCAILPAKFGAVYERADDLRQALQGMQDAVRAQLRRVDGCDEWAVHLYVDPAVVAAARADTAVRRLEQELAGASPGKAYFVQRKLADERARAAERAMSAIAEEAYDALAPHARAGQVVARPQPPIHARGEAEALRATFLVPRPAADAFLDGMRAYAGSRDGVRWEYSGPLPPYSFAALTEQEAPQ